MGQGVVSCIAAWHIASPRVFEITRPLSAPSAVQLAQGYNAVLGPKYQSGAYIRVGEATVPYGSSTGADLHQAGRVLPDLVHDVNVVVAADDPLADAVGQSLQSSGVAPRTVAVVGQDASLPAAARRVAGVSVRVGVRARLRRGPGRCGAGAVPAGRGVPAERPGRPGGDRHDHQFPTCPPSCSRRVGSRPPPCGRRWSPTTTSAWRRCAPGTPPRRAAKRASPPRAPGSIEGPAGE